MVRPIFVTLHVALISYIDLWIQSFRLWKRQDMINYNLVMLTIMLYSQMWAPYLFVGPTKDKSDHKKD